MPDQYTYQDFMRSIEDQEPGGEQTMPPRPRSIYELVQEHSNRFPSPEALSTTPEGRLNHSFLIVNINEVIGVVTDLHRSDGYYRYRQYLIGRPFYVKNIVDVGEGWKSASCRCMVRREELAPGNNELRDLRSFSVGRAKFTIVPVEERENVYNDYLRRANPDLAEVGDEFEFKIVPDDESKMKKRRIPKRQIKFHGLWNVQCARPENRGFVYLALNSNHIDATGACRLLFHLCDYNGHPIADSNLLSITGDNLAGELGYITPYLGITRNVPFELDERGRVTIREIE